MAVFFLYRPLTLFAVNYEVEARIWEYRFGLSLNYLNDRLGCLPLIGIFGCI